MWENIALWLEEKWMDRYPPIGIRGIKRANRILKKYGAIGVLFGGVAKKIWSSIFAYDFRGNRDVDVLILSADCKQHPRQWAGGID